MNNQQSWHSQLFQAENYAHIGQNEQFIAICTKLLRDHATDLDLILRISALYLAYGYPSYSRDCISDGLMQFPQNEQLLIVLANSKLQLGQIEQCQAIYLELLKCSQSNPQVLRNLIFLSEYLLSSSNYERLTLAKSWAEVTVKNAFGPHSRPKLRLACNRKMRLGYVSADFCQHTVGILIKNILARHNKEQFEVFCYSSGFIHDVVTESIRKNSQFLDVVNFSDFELASRIHSDEIDILVDLSGHTGGSRLAAFAYRPAPVQLSWLGYYATTGLDVIDAALLDRWHIHEQIDAQFVEPVISLPAGRWCYYPAIEPAPLISDPPSITNEYITFGSFNNTLKLNHQVFSLWAKILHAVPKSKLLLKWRTFNDPEFKQFVLEKFTSLGIESSRIELRGPSFHMEMMAQYNEIDIALDPFPFSGGVTSCEALYMGVPVITCPKDRVVSRQTYAFLASIGLPELITHNEKQYFEKAVYLAENQSQLVQYRRILREKMFNSNLMQSDIFIKSLESTYIELFNKIYFLNQA